MNYATESNSYTCQVVNQRKKIKVFINFGCAVIHARQLLQERVEVRKRDCAPHNEKPEIKNHNCEACLIRNK